MVSSAMCVGLPAATTAVRTSAAAAFRGPGAAWRSGLGFLGWCREDPGGEAEKCETRVAQEAAAPESNLRELFLIDRRLEFCYLSLVQRHTRLPPFERFPFCEIYRAALLQWDTS